MAARIDALGVATLLLAAVVTACQPQAQPGGAATGTPAASPSIGTGEWKVYRSDLGGFAVEIPAGWAVQETIEVGSVLAAFGPSPGSVEIDVRVHAPIDGGGSDLPNVHCQETEVGAALP